MHPLARLVAAVRHQVAVRSKVIVTLAWPIASQIAFAFTPAAIISEAKVWRPSCSVIGSSCAAFHAVSARRRTVDGSNGRAAVAPNTSASHRGR
jgi:hypothetical protein